MDPTGEQTDVKTGDIDFFTDIFVSNIIKDTVRAIQSMKESLISWDALEHGVFGDTESVFNSLGPQTKQYAEMYLTRYFEVQMMKSLQENLEHEDCSKGYLFPAMLKEEVHVNNSEERSFSVPKLTESFCSTENSSFLNWSSMSGLRSLAAARSFASPTPMAAMSNPAEHIVVNEREKINSERMNTSGEKSDLLTDLFVNMYVADILKRTVGNVHQRESCFLWHALERNVSEDRENVSNNPKAITKRHLEACLRRYFDMQRISEKSFVKQQNEGTNKHNISLTMVNKKGQEKGIVIDIIPDKSTTPSLSSSKSIDDLSQANVASNSLSPHLLEKIASSTRAVSNSQVADSCSKSKSETSGKKGHDKDINVSNESGITCKTSYMAVSPSTSAALSGFGGSDSCPLAFERTNDVSPVSKRKGDFSSSTNPSSAPQVSSRIAFSTSSPPSTTAVTDSGSQARPATREGRHKDVHNKTLEKRAFPSFPISDQERRTSNAIAAVIPEKSIFLRSSAALQKTSKKPAVCESESSITTELTKATLRNIHPSMVDEELKKNVHQLVKCFKMLETQEEKDIKNVFPDSQTLLTTMAAEDRLGATKTGNVAPFSGNGTERKDTPVAQRPPPASFTGLEP
ncbi:uncharacterized protein LOC103396241 [Cynoglossus semilaevis]|uniref:uncharacterized protein LOC103396241 n=1 Tax=Cynoglossus semilaevis TaxID=244447 RepID=UPI000495B6E4|nr:uncharacterized protein LOC103396241 [Cynoglossus semilaevis]